MKQTLNFFQKSQKLFKIWPSITLSSHSLFSWKRNRQIAFMFLFMQILAPLSSFAILCYARDICLISFVFKFLVLQTYRTVYLIMNNRMRMKEKYTNHHHLFSIYSEKKSISITCTEICTPADDYCHHSEKCTCENLSIYVHQQFIWKWTTMRRAPLFHAQSIFNIILSIYLYSNLMMLYYLWSVWLVGFIAYNVAYFNVAMGKINMRDEKEMWKNCERCQSRKWLIKN
jgi:hypothetical protein